MSEVRQAPFFTTGRIVRTATDADPIPISRAAMTTVDNAKSDFTSSPPCLDQATYEQLIENFISPDPRPDVKNTASEKDCKQQYR